MTFAGQDLIGKKMLSTWEEAGRENGLFSAFLSPFLPEET